MPELNYGTQPNEPFIPPPPGAIQEGIPLFNSLPGPMQPSITTRPFGKTGLTIGIPVWAQRQSLQHRSTQEWIQGQQQISSTPTLGYRTSMPAASWGSTTPRRSWGPPTPISGDAQPGVFDSSKQPAASGNSSGERKREAHQGYRMFGNLNNVQDPPDTGFIRSGLQRRYPRRSRSLDTSRWRHPQQEMQAHSEYNYQNLARRPRDWRHDYDMRGGPTLYRPWKSAKMSDITEWNDPIKRTLHFQLVYSPRIWSIYLDLRTNPFSPDSTLYFPARASKPTSSDLAQLVTQPPAQALRLYHTLLPWYIDIHQTHPSGVTLLDVLDQMWQQMNKLIWSKHFYNECVDHKMRAEIGEAYAERCAGNPLELSQGIRRIDWLGEKIIFEGLTKGHDGMWEIKTRRIDWV